MIDYFKKDPTHEDLQNNKNTFVNIPLHLILLAKQYSGSAFTRDPAGAYSN